MNRLKPITETAESTQWSHYDLASRTSSGPQGPRPSCPRLLNHRWCSPQCRRGASMRGRSRMRQRRIAPGTQRYLHPDQEITLKVCNKRLPPTSNQSGKRSSHVAKPHLRMSWPQVTPAPSTNLQKAPAYVADADDCVWLLVSKPRAGPGGMSCWSR